VLYSNSNAYQYNKLNYRKTKFKTLIFRKTKLHFIGFLIFFVLHLEFFKGTT